MSKTYSAAIAARAGDRAGRQAAGRGAPAGDGGETLRPGSPPTAPSARSRI